MTKTLNPNGAVVIIDTRAPEGRAAVLGFMKAMSAGACFGKPSEAQVRSALGDDFMDFLNRKYPGRPQTVDRAASKVRAA